MENPCVHVCCCSGCRFLSVVSGPKVSSSTVTFSPSQDLLCLTTVVWGSSSADDTWPSSVGCMWARRRVTGSGWEMAADIGVTEPKGHEGSHKVGENIGWVMEDNQSGGQLLWVAFVSLSCSLALSVYSSLPHLALPSSATTAFVFSFSLSLSLLCSLYCSVGFRQCCPFPSLTLWWRDGLWSEGAMKRWRPSAQGNTHLFPSFGILLPLNIYPINYLLSVSVSLQNSWLLSVHPNHEKHTTEPLARGMYCSHADRFGLICPRYDRI